jgi:hypothetical protein
MPSRKIEGIKTPPLPRTTSICPSSQRLITASIVLPRLGNVFHDLSQANADPDQFKEILAAEISRTLDKERLTVRESASAHRHRCG